MCMKGKPMSVYVEYNNIPYLHKGLGGRLLEVLDIPEETIDSLYLW